MNEVIAKDAASVANDERLPWMTYDGKTIVVTGATGLIGQSLVASLAKRSEATHVPMKLVCLVRNPEKASKMFEGCDCVELVEWDALSLGHEIDVLNPDVIFHCANMTSSSDFINKPVEVIKSTVYGAQSMLELAHRSDSRICLLSTMETYGEVIGDEPIQEKQGGFLDPMVVRNSYPEAKRIDEALCAAYASEYGVKAVVVRLTQTFGPGVARDDTRVFAEFARCAIGGQDIIMLTDGKKRNSYLYTADAVKALLVACARGESGEAYNAANDDTFCEVREMAEMVASQFGKGRCAVRFEFDDEAAKRFRKGKSIDMDTARLRALGWEPEVNLRMMFARMIEGWAS